MLLDLQTAVESQLLREVEGHPLVLKDSHQLQLEHLLSHFHRNVKGSIAPKLLDLQTVMEFQYPREDDVRVHDYTHQLVLQCGYCGVHVQSIHKFSGHGDSMRLQ